MDIFYSRYIIYTSRAFHGYFLQHGALNIYTSRASHGYFLQDGALNIYTSRASHCTLQHRTSNIFIVRINASKKCCLLTYYAELYFYFITKLKCMENNFSIIITLFCWRTFALNKVAEKEIITFLLYIYGNIKILLSLMRVMFKEI